MEKTQELPLKTAKQKECTQNAAEKTTAKQATSRQLVVVIFMLGLATKMFLQPVFLIRAAGRDAYIAMAIDGGLDLISLGLWLAALRLSREKNLFDLIESVFGKVGAKIAVGIIGLFLFFKLNMASAETLAFYADSVFADFNAAVMIVVLLVFFGAVANHTLRALNRLNELLAPLIVLCLVLLIAITLVTGFDFGNIFPVLEDKGGFTRAVTTHASWLGDFTPLALFVGRTEVKKRTLPLAATAGVTGTGVAVFFAIVMCAAFGNVQSLVDSGTNLSSVIQYSIGNVFGRVDLFSTLLWSMAAFIQSALFFYSAARCFEYVIGIKNHLWVGVGLCAITYALQYFLLSDPTLFSIAATELAVNMTVAALSFLIPLTATVCAVISRKRERGRA